MLKQKTLKDSFSLSGKGLHTGLDLTVTFNPAPDNHGYKIQRIDVEGQPIIDAVADNVTETTRGTVLSKNGVKVSTVEHGMAALYALGIDNCLIQVNGPEFPILDGSAQYYAQEIERVGTEEQNAVKDFYIIKSKIEFRDEKTGISINPGCKEEDMAELAVITKRLDFHLEQVQDFTPTPMTVATEAWYTGYHPYTLEPVFSAKTPREKLAQRQFFFWYKPEERKNIINELRRIGRSDLIDKLYGKR